VKEKISYSGFVYTVVTTNINFNEKTLNTTVRCFHKKELAKEYAKKLAAKIVDDIERIYKLTPSKTFEMSNGEYYYIEVNNDWAYRVDIEEHHNRLSPTVCGSDYEEEFYEVPVYVNIEENK